jgi:hypothetical protein
MPAVVAMTVNMLRRVPAGVEEGTNERPRGANFGVSVRACLALENSFMEFQAQHRLLVRGGSSLPFCNRYPDIRTMCPPRPATGALNPTATFRANKETCINKPSYWKT